MDKIKVAVTGAAGHIGSVLVRRMLEFPHIEPVAICRNKMSAALIHSVAAGCDIRIGSITEVNSTKKMLGDCDAVINCALAIVTGQPKISRQLNRAMVDSFSRMKNLKLLIHMSTVSVYGEYIDSKKSQKRAFERPCPNGDYGRSKLYVERYAESLCLSRQIRYYILRLGHVYGAGMDRSREMIELAKTPNFRLPFNGELPSNMIHVERLAAMVIALISAPLACGIYNVAEKRTWRQVFDWHTEAIGLGPVKGMSQNPSEDLRTIYRSASVAREVGNWLRSLPILSLVRYPAFFNWIYRLLYVVPFSVTTRLATLYKRLETGRQISDLNGHYNGVVNPIFFIDAMPGAYLNLPSEAQVHCPSEGELSEELRIWYERFSRPTWLRSSVSGRSAYSDAGLKLD